MWDLLSVYAVSIRKVQDAPIVVIAIAAYRPGVSVLGFLFLAKPHPQNLIAGKVRLVGTWLITIELVTH